LVELPKSQVLAVAPSLTELALKPAIAAVNQTDGSLEYTLRRCCALSDPAHTINNIAREKRLIISLQVVLRFARGVG
jgi:hypothetical protein